MAVVSDNDDSRSIKSLLAAHSRKFVMRMTMLLVICFVGIAVVAFFLLRGPGKAGTPAHSQEGGKSSSTLSPEQGLNGDGLKVESSSDGSTDQADGSSQAALQYGVGVSTSPNSASDVQHAGSVNGGDSSDDSGQPGNTGGSGSSGGGTQAPVATDPIIIYPPIKYPPVGGGCTPCGGPVVNPYNNIKQQIVCPDYCIQME
ncbi:MAG TPA: hypothetical protein VLH84_01330 [Patescibacteria group bacterium]|nr:hypothetical protein [Patescibacteria group bacterium]